jgi:DNA polymerase
VQRCPKCPGTNSCVPGDGPECKEHLFLLEAPGPTENRRGIPLVGKTGDETNRQYFPIAGLKRENVRVDNCIHCLPVTQDGKLDIKRKIDLELLESCTTTHLYPYLERVKPRLIVSMGAFACHALDPEISLDMHHGIPQKTCWGTVFPMYHPAGGIHEPKKMLQIRTDWTRLRKYFLGKLYIPKDIHKSPQYEEVTSCIHLDSILAGCNDYIMACDTEVMRGGKPFCLTFSIQEGAGYLIRAERLDILERFQWYIDHWENYILFHNWLFDALVVARMGLKFPHRRIKDTMVMAFELGNLPQALKTLAYRELGMEMQDFSDLVTPYSIPLAMKFLRDAYMEDWPKPDPEMYRDPKTGLWKTKQPQSMSTKLKRFFTDLGKNLGKDLFTAWDNWEDSHEMIEKEIGPWPGKCISYVPFEKVIHYACRDADATLRLWPVMKWMMSRVRKAPQENWGKNGRVA